MTERISDRWLLFIMQLPTRPAAPRIKLWRRLQQIGSVALRGSVYVLPHTPQAREDFEWLRGEVIAAGGQASILSAETLTADEHATIQQGFRDARAPEFKALAAAVSRVATRRRPLPSTARRAAERALRSAEQRLAELEAIDYGAAPERDAAASAIAALAARLATNERNDAMSVKAETLAPARYKNRTWVTRPRPGVDRMSSAWLIRRFIDAKARFAFRSAPPPSSSREVPFDMFGVAFGHDGDRCTFEVLASRLGIADAAIQRIGEIVHDVDLKDRRYGHPESAVVHDLVEGLRRAHADDHELLEHGMTMFGGLYESFKATTPPPRRAKSRRGSRNLTRS
jgi:hypothetical protein